jgi:hypothetical protein
VRSFLDNVPSGLGRGIKDALDKVERQGIELPSSTLLTPEESNSERHIQACQRGMVLSFILLVVVIVVIKHNNLLGKKKKKKKKKMMISQKIAVAAPAARKASSSSSSSTVVS